MGARPRTVYAIIIAAIAATGSGWWAWSQYCEKYGLCYPACRAASNGVAYWKTVAAITVKSGLIAAKASPGSECLSVLDVVRKQYVGKQVAIDHIDLGNERKPAPFYQYECTFDIKDPVFVLGRSKECSASDR